MTAQIILASASPRRRELLRQIGIEVIVQAVDIDETPREGEAVLDYVGRLATEKALAGREAVVTAEDLPCLGSDTVVELEGEILGKPADRDHARRILQKLSSKRHTVHTAVAIVTGERQRSLTSSSQVDFMTLDDPQIEAYLATGEADDKAGAYAIQGIAAQFIRHIEGSFSGIMGLPLYETTILLKQCGIDPLSGVRQ